MSENDVRILKDVFDAMARGEVTALVQRTDEEIRVYPRPEEPGVRDVYEGWEGLEEYMVNWFSGWDDYGVEAVRFIDTGDEVIAVARERGRIEGSGMELVEDFTHSFRLRDGRIVEWRMYDSHAQALERFGLQE